MLIKTKKIVYLNLHFIYLDYLQFYINENQNLAK